MSHSRKLSVPMTGILNDFNRQARRGEYSDRDGFVLRPVENVTHFDGRSFSALVSRGLLDFFIRCECVHPCCCTNNGYHITKLGRKALTQP